MRVQRVRVQCVRVQLRAGAVGASPARASSAAREWMHARLVRLGVKHGMPRGALSVIIVVRFLTRLLLPLEAPPEALLAVVPCAPPPCPHTPHTCSGSFGSLTDGSSAGVRMHPPWSIRDTSHTFRGATWSSTECAGVFACVPSPNSAHPSHILSSPRALHRGLQWR